MSNQRLLSIAVEGDTEPMPGDTILDRYLVGASQEERERARASLQRLAKLIVRVHRRLARDNPQPPTPELACSAVDSESPT